MDHKYTNKFCIKYMTMKPQVCRQSVSEEGFMQWKITNNRIISRRIIRC
jgi:hypothetical protein